jgi:hypothetical protein
LFAQLVQEDEATAVQLRWPVTANAAYFTRLLGQNLAEAAQLPSSTPAVETMRALSRHPAPYYVTTDLSLDHVSAHEHERLEALRAFLKPWAAFANAPRVVVLWVVYKPVRERLFGLIKGGDRRNATMRQALEKFLAREPERLLPQLANVREDDALEWTNRSDVKRRAGRDLRDDVRRLFARSADGLAMKPAAHALSSLLRPQKSQELLK